MLAPSFDRRDDPGMRRLFAASLLFCGVRLYR